MDVLSLAEEGNNWRTTYFRHMLLLTVKFFYACSDCPFKSKNKLSFGDHFKNLHGEKDESTCEKDESEGENALEPAEDETQNRVRPIKGLVTPPQIGRAHV